MRICLFTPTFYPAVGGAERDADVIAQNLQARGHHVVVLTRRLRGRMPELPYPVLTYRRPPKQHLWPEVLALPLLRAHRKHRFDVVLALYSYPTGYAASIVKRRMGARLVMAPQGADLYSGYHDLRKLRVSTLIRRGYRSADYIINLSREMGRRLVEIVGDPVPPMEVVPNGIDVAEHHRLCEQARAQITSPPVTGRFILHLARVNAVKGQETAVEAVRTLAKEFRKRDVKYVFVGDGNALGELRRLIQGHHLEEIALTLGTRTGMEKYWLFANAMFMVSTSREEGCPNVVIEAMASGQPMLASDIPVHGELIAERNWGELFKLDDPVDMAGRLANWLDRDLTPLRNNALRSSADFTIDKMIDRYEAACEPL